MTRGHSAETNRRGTRTRWGEAYEVRLLSTTTIAENSRERSTTLRDTITMNDVCGAGRGVGAMKLDSAPRAPWDMGGTTMGTTLHCGRSSNVLFELHSQRSLVRFAGSSRGRNSARVNVPQAMTVCMLIC